MEIYDEVTACLAMLGYQTVEDDKPVLEYLIAKCQTALLANINQPTLPDGLFYTLVDMAAGSFLHDKLAAGGLEIEGLDFDRPAKSITEGDVSVAFEETDSTETRFRSKLDGMMHPPESILGAFRRLRW